MKAANVPRCRLGMMALESNWMDMKGRSAGPNPQQILGAFYPAARQNSTQYIIYYSLLIWYMNVICSSIHNDEVIFIYLPGMIGISSEQ